MTQGTRTDLSPEVERSSLSGEVAEQLAKKAEGKKTQGNRTDLTSAPNGAKVRNSKVLADKAGVGHGSITRLITVYRNRLDLFERVFDGTYSINKAYTEMKADEARSGFLFNFKIVCGECPTFLHLIVHTYIGGVYKEIP